MDYTTSTSNPQIEPFLARIGNDRVKRLLLDRHLIRARMINPGGSIILTASGLIDTEQFDDYSTEIGSSDHLDLLDLEQQLKECITDGTFTVEDILALFTWMDDMSSQQAAIYLNARGPVNFRADAIRRKRGNAVKTLTDGINGES